MRFPDPMSVIDTMLAFLLPDTDLLTSPAEPGAPPAVPLVALAVPAELAYAAVRTMIAAALCDGRLANEERAAVERRLAAANLSDEEIARVHKDLVLPANPEELAALVPGATDREVLFRLAWRVLRADGEVLDSERAWLDHLGEAFDIEPVRRVELAPEPAASPAEPAAQ